MVDSFFWVERTLKFILYLKGCKTFPPIVCRMPLLVKGRTVIFPVVELGLYLFALVSATDRPTLRSAIKKTNKEASLLEKGMDYSCGP